MMNSSDFITNNENGNGPFSSESERLLSYKDFQDYESFYAMVYQKMYQCLFSYGMQICGNRELVKDSIQELFSQLWKNQRTLPKVKSIKPYLLKCLKRKIKRELGKGRRLRVEGNQEFEISHETRLIRDEHEREGQHRLHTFMKSLTVRQREAIYLKFYGHLPYEEVAQVLNIRTKAAYKLIYRALSALKEAMRPPLC